LVHYIWLTLGYTLTGVTTEQTIWLLWGTGANGKSTFLTIVAYILGSYGHIIPFTTIELPQRSAIPDDLAALRGKRFVSASEAIEGARLNEARLKVLSGGDPVPARHLYGRWFSYIPALKMFLSCNHLPRVEDDSHGFWRRVRLVPFLRQFTGEARDPELLNKLRAEASGILNWMVQGCLRWQAEGGLPVPAAVRAATGTFRAESDALTDFLLERCEVDAAATCGATELFSAYSAWAQSRGLATSERLSPTKFGTRMSIRFDKEHTRTGRIYRGIRLRTRARDWVSLLPSEAQ
jgi:putative DNA primase/helicase